MIDKYYGETEKNVKALFSLAKKVEPVIILVDEIDCMLQTRSESTNEAKNFMAEFLVRMDDIQKNTLSKTIIFAATNRLEDVDAAILRRLPMKFKVDKPVFSLSFCISFGFFIVNYINLASVFAPRTPSGL